jgi:pimeloyl-ACP methyl ester carboxylesterase
LTQILSHKRFVPKRQTLLYVSGWTQNPDAETSKLLINAYLNRGDYNVLVLDWGDYSVGTYGAVMIRISRISRIFGRAWLKLFDKGLNVKSFHCVGHSFGAHACGIMGRELNQVSHRRLKFGRFDLFLLIF